MHDKVNEIEDALVKLNDVLLSSEHHHIAIAFSSVSRSKDLHTMLSSMLVNANVRYINQDLLHGIITNSDVKDVDFADVQMPVGLVSSDSAAVLGRSGVLFLVGGSNDVIGQYSPQYPEHDTLYEQWKNLIETRLSSATRHNVRLHQVIIPEKISIVPEFFPASIVTPTRLLNLIEKYLINNHDDLLYTPVCYIFSQHPNRMQLIKKMDSHLSPLGTFVIFREILKRVCNTEIAEFEFDHLGSAIGDLCYRMFGLFLPEQFLEVKSSSLPDFINAAFKIMEVVPQQNGHMGWKQSWRNPSAPIKKKVIVFGNSYFSLVENGQSNLSWWFSRWFEEYHFVWTNELDWDYVNEIRPEFVIWQGTERFLPVVPAS